VVAVGPIPRHRTHFSRLGSGPLLLVLCFVWSCSGQTEPSRLPEVITVVSGDGQSATVGEQIIGVFQVRDPRGPVTGAVVTFLVTEGGGETDLSRATTASDGRVQVRWRLGSEARNQRLVARTESGHEAVLGATALGVAPAQISVTPSRLSGFRGNIVDSTIWVLVVDAFGLPVVGEPVNFRVVSGNGMLAGPIISTNGDGLARLAGWRLGPEPGVQALQVSSGQALREIEVMAVEPPPTHFNIDVRFVGEVSAEESTAVHRARKMWESVLLSELPDVTLLQSPDPSCPVQSGETIDDVLVFVSFGEIDRSQGGTLGLANTCLGRAETGLPLVGWFVLDSEFILEGGWELEDVARHEFGHVLGMTRSGPWARQTGGPIFAGEGARQAYMLAGAVSLPLPAGCPGIPQPLSCDGFPPVDPSSSHWREDVLGTELMTPTGSVGPEPLSAITVLAFRDLGYVVDEARAEPFTLPALLSSLVPPSLRRARDRVQTVPVQFVNQAGRIVR